METAIVVFTRDLRLHDNPALHQACTRARQVVPLFVVDPAIPAPPNRARFLADSLADLRHQLRARRADLVIRHGDPAAEVITLASETQAGAVYLADDVSRYAARRRQRLERECARHRLDLVFTPGLTVVPPGDLTPANGDHYKVFTPYWRAWLGARWRRHCPVPGVLTMPAIERPGRLPAVRHADSPGLDQGGETEGRRRFLAWRQHDLAGYPENHDDLASAKTSRLSAYLRFGCVSPLEVAIGAGDRPPARGTARSSPASWPGGTSSTRSPPRSRTWPAGTTAPARPGPRTSRRWPPGGPARPASPSSTPGCASWPPRASCTTAPG